MKKIICGKLCNTETAKELGSYSFSYPSQFNWYRETLYRTKSGTYFLHGEGNAASPYAYACPTGGFDPGEKIRVLEPDDAKAWAEDKLDVDDYLKIFGDPEDISTVQICVTVPVEVKKHMEDLKATVGMTFSEIVATAVMHYGEE